MNTPKRPYVPPTVTVCRIELESPICSGSVFTPEKEDITIHDQGFATTDNGWSGDFSQEDNWNPTSSNQ